MKDWLQKALKKVRSLPVPEATHQLANEIVRAFHKVSLKPSRIRISADKDEIVIGCSGAGEYRAISCFDDGTLVLTVMRKKREDYLVSEISLKTVDALVELWASLQPEKKGNPDV